MSVSKAAIWSSEKKRKLHIGGASRSAQQAAPASSSRSSASGRISSSSTSPPSSSSSRANPFAEGGEFDEWSGTGPGSSGEPRLAQQTAEPSQQQSFNLSNPRQGQANSQQPQQSASPGNDSWSTGGFDFDDLNRDVSDRALGSDRGRSGRPPSRSTSEPRTAQRQSSPRSRQQASPMSERPNNRKRNSRQPEHVGKPDRVSSTDTETSSGTDKSREDFDAFWNQF